MNNNYWQALLAQDIDYPPWCEELFKEAQKAMDSERLLQETEDKGLKPF